jgi:uncharacterized protein YggT (Ycf19 family)
VAFILFVISRALFIFELMIIVYAILSWFPLSPSGIFYQIRDFIARLIEPILSKIRPYMPRNIPIDLSFIVLVVLLIIAQAIVGALYASAA